MVPFDHQWITFCFIDCILVRVKVCIGEIKNAGQFMALIEPNRDGNIFFKRNLYIHLMFLD